MMDQRHNLLFYDAYESFYAMAAHSAAFRSYCSQAFGEDFSQDGFSDVQQIDLILQTASLSSASHILDIGCGNGKMLSYLQRKTGARISGFDYSVHAIQTARALHPFNADFRVGIIGEIQYPVECFDLITSMDTLYFAKDMTNFVSQVKSWLKPNGILFAGYQEGDVTARTESVQTTELTKALHSNQMPFRTMDITRQTYELLQRKRQAALHHQTAFEAEGHREWFDLLIDQTQCALAPYDQFQQKMARYIYIAQKQ
ncbi:MAG: class I SAM-dependent methyltransferase [Clostridia bacterium]|nr:class I SAM-dependent methyltransferase [Clostridia bacterium]